MDYKYTDKGYVLGYMPDIDDYLSYDSVEEYSREYRKLKEEAK